MFATPLFAVAPRKQVGSPSSSSDFAELSTRANAARDANQLQQAAALYGKALALRPEWLEGWWSLGTIEYDQDDYADAARVFEKVKALDPKAGTARLMLGLCQFELGDDDSALRNIEEGRKIGIAEDPQLRHVMLYHQGVLLQRKSRFEAAQNELNHICADNVEDESVAQALGMAALHISGKSSPLEGSPGASVIAGVGHAECLSAQKKFDVARQSFEELTKNYPEYPNLHFAYGKFLVEVDDTGAAVEEFKREIQNDPDHVFARLEIAAVKYKVDSEAGLPYALEAVQRSPQMPFAHYLLGLLLVDTQSYSKAIPELEIANKAFPDEAKVYFALSSAYAHVGRQQDAARAKAAFLRLNQQVPAGPASNVYGQEPHGEASEMLDNESNAKNPQ
jgi:tetratricopeptide (TPR) repeat protein